MNRGFTALSGIAMLLIVINHTIHMGTTVPVDLGYEPFLGTGRNILRFLEALGIFAVPTFLFISGSFVAYATRSNKNVLSLRFIWASLRHILWPYLLWSVIFYIVTYLNRGWVYPVTGYLKNLVVGFPFHFIPLLIFYYVVSPFLVILGNRIGWVLIALIGAYQILLNLLLNQTTLGLNLADQLQILIPPVIGNTMADWAVFFPMGLVYNLKSKQAKPFLIKWTWLFIILTVGTFALGLLHGFGILNAPLARIIAPFFLMFVIAIVNRNKIPFLRVFEYIGKRSYGLYLTHLIVLDSMLFILYSLIPPLLAVQAILLPLLLASALIIPLYGMKIFNASATTRRIYRHVFG